MIDAFRQNVFEGITAGVALCRMDGRYLAVNQAYCELTGRSQDELLALRYQDIVHPDDGLRSAEAASGLLTGRARRFSLEKRCLRKDGTTRWVRVSGSLAPDGTGEQAILAVVEDLTARKLAEEALAAARATLVAPSTAARIAEEAARRRLGRQLHNGAAQLLTALAMNLAAVRATAPGKAQDDLLDTALELTEQCSVELRTAAALLETPDLARAGLPGSVETWARAFARRSGLRVETRIESTIRLTACEEHCLFRIAQESLAEIAEFSGSRNASIALHFDGDDVVLQIGYDDSESKPRAGLPAGWFGLRERAELIGGRFEPAAPPDGAGFTVRIRPSAPPLQFVENPGHEQD